MRRKVISTTLNDLLRTPYQKYGKVAGLDQEIDCRICTQFHSNDPSYPVAKVRMESPNHAVKILAKV